MSTPLHDLPVVLLHGWPVTELHWRHVSPLLRQAGFTPVPVTLPGLGTPPEKPQSFRKIDLAKWLHDELVRRGITRFALIGHDWGGTVASLLTASIPSAVTALVIEEEILPGLAIEIPSPGKDDYPSWHGPFNRAPGLAERLVPGREPAYYGTFLQQSAGPASLEPHATRAYIEAYSAPGVLEAGLGYYRTRSNDLVDVQLLTANPIATPVLAIGGRWAMGTAVADGIRALADNVTGVVLDQSGHYPVEQQPEQAAHAIIEFLHRQHHPSPDR